MHDTESATDHPTALECQEAFLDALSPQSHFGRLFDALDRISFFVKDREGRLLFGNRHLLRVFGLRSEAELVGMTDFDLFGTLRAEKYRGDDRQIMASGEPMLRIIEIFVNAQGLPGWFITHKYPLFDRNGKTVGVMGTIQPYDDYQKLLPPHRDIQPVLEFVQANYQEPLAIPELAELAGVSVRDLERKFKQHFNLTPQQYIIKFRIYKACEMIRGAKSSLASIAADLGFCDQSALTRHFKNVMGTTPTKYRREYA